MTLTRRKAMQTMAALGAAPLVRPNDAPLPRNIVVAGAHPDDPESGAGGTARRLVDLGHKVTFLYLTRGESGIPDATAKTAARRREEEALAASKLLGATAVFLGQVDGATTTDETARADFRKKLAALSPELVLTHWPLDTHRDHRACAELVLDAWVQKRSAFSLLFFEVLAGYQTQTFAPDVYVDITPVVELKRRSVFCHQSQDPKAIWEHHEVMHRFRGLETHASLAEAFVHHRPSPTCDLLVPLAPRPR
jgi:N-acetylglucosamine malate deacetylase 1